MKLSVLERMLIQHLIPKESNFSTLKLIRVAREALSFTDDEMKSLNMREIGEGPDRKMMWDNTVPEKEIEIGETVTCLIVKELSRLDKENKLTSDHLTVYEKFMQGV